MNRALIFLPLIACSSPLNRSFESADVSGPNEASVGETVTLSATGQIHSQAGEISDVWFFSNEPSETQLLAEPVFRIVSVEGGAALPSEDEPVSLEDGGWSGSLALTHDDKVIEVTVELDVTCQASGELVSDTGQVGLEFGFSSTPGGGVWQNEDFPFTCTE